VFSPPLEKSDVLGVARRRARRLDDPFEAQEIFFGGDGKRMRANRRSCRLLGELLSGNGEIEQKIDPKAGLAVEEICAAGRVEAPTTCRWSTASRIVTVSRDRFPEDGRRMCSPA
jgi:hypothetical protein